MQLRSGPYSEKLLRLLGSSSDPKTQGHREARSLEQSQRKALSQKKLKRMLPYRVFPLRLEAVFLNFFPLCSADFL